MPEGPGGHRVSLRHERRLLRDGKTEPSLDFGSYTRLLNGIPGITCLPSIPNAVPNHSYFPVLVDAARFGMSRDELFSLLRQCNIVAKKYFYPLISSASCYSAVPSAASSNLAVAERVAKEIICLPIYGTLDHDAVRTVCSVIADVQQAA
jgi:dTDP-4-amino-4,6-dideoxygalactose transaminase